MELLQPVSPEARPGSVATMNTSVEKRNVSICEIAGCTDHAISERWIVVSDGSQRRIEVCWKHDEGELDPTAVGDPAG